MQLNALRYFDAIVRYGSMRRAAESLGVAPTAVSRQIENLEYHFGAPLFERTSRGVMLTAAGRVLAAQAGRTLRELDQARQRIADLKGLEGGTVRLFASGALVASVIAPALAGFSARHPRITFEVTIASTPAALEAVASAEADVAVTLFAEPAAGVRPHFEVDLAYDAIVAAGHGAAGRSEMTLDALAGERLALPEEGFAARRAIDAMFARAGLVVEPVFVTSSLELLRELVLSGAAITLLPAAAVARERAAGLVAAVPIAGDDALRARIEIRVAEDRAPTFATSALLEFLRRFVTGNEGDGNGDASGVA